MTTVANFDVNILNPIFDYFLRKVKEVDREDVKHDSILKILEALNDGKIKNNLFSYSYTVVRGKVCDYYREKNNRVNSNTILVNFHDGADKEKGSTVEYFNYQTEKESYKFRVIEIRQDYLNNRHKFTRQERKIIDFMLFTEEGPYMKPTQISNELGLHKSHASRALKKLRKICQEEAVSF